MAEVRRVHIHGFKAEVSDADICTRFSAFGAVSDVHVGRDADGRALGYAHFTLVPADGGSWLRLLSAYNGATWRGGKLRIEAAKRLARGRPAGPPPAEKKEKKRRPLVRHAADMALVTDAAVRKGWKRSRYGRLVLLARVRRPDGRVVTVDPDHHRERYEKLFGSVRPKPLSALTWRLSDDERRDVSSDSDSDDSDSSAADSACSEPNLGDATGRHEEIARNNHEAALQKMGESGEFSGDAGQGLLLNFEDPFAPRCGSYASVQSWERELLGYRLQQQ